MIYQFSGILVKLLPVVILADLIFIFLIFLSTKAKKKRFKRIYYIVAIIGFLGFWLIKILMFNPHSLSFKPSYLKISHNDFFNSVYYFNERKNKVFWKEHLIGKSKTRLLDQKRFNFNKVYIIKKFEDQYYYTSIKLKINETSNLLLEKRNFKEDTDGKMQKYVDDYYLVEKGNYLSNFINILFIGLLVWRFRKYGF